MDPASAVGARDSGPVGHTVIYPLRQRHAVVAGRVQPLSGHGKTCDLQLLGHSLEAELGANLRSDFLAVVEVGREPSCGDTRVLSARRDRRPISMRSAPASQRTSYSNRSRSKSAPKRQFTTARAFFSKAAVIPQASS